MKKGRRTMEEQRIEVEFDTQLLEDELEIQELGTEEDLVQDTFNLDSVEELLGEGAEINDKIN